MNWTPLHVLFRDFTISFENNMEGGTSKAKTPQKKCLKRLRQKCTQNMLKKITEYIESPYPLDTDYIKSFCSSIGE